MQRDSSVGFGYREAAIFVIAIMGVAAGLAAFSFSSLMRNVPLGGETARAVAEGLGSFQSYSELQDFMAANAKSAQLYSRQGTWFGQPKIVFGGAIPILAVTAAETAVVQ